MLVLKHGSVVLPISDDPICPSPRNVLVARILVARAGVWICLQEIGGVRWDSGTLGFFQPVSRLLGIHYRGVQWEGGAVDGGSIIS